MLTQRKLTMRLLPATAVLLAVMAGGLLVGGELITVLWAALGMTAVTTITILVVLVHTINVARRGGICVPED